MAKKQTVEEINERIQELRSVILELMYNEERRCAKLDLKSLKNIELSRKQLQALTNQRNCEVKRIYSAHANRISQTSFRPTKNLKS